MTTRSSVQWGACACCNMSIFTPWSSRILQSPEPALPMTDPALRAGTSSLLDSSSGWGSLPGGLFAGPWFCISTERRFQTILWAWMTLAIGPTMVQGLIMRTSSFPKCTLTCVDSRICPKVAPDLPMMAPLYSLGIQKIVVKLFVASSEPASAWVTALCTNCSAAQTWENVPTAMTRRSGGRMPCTVRVETERRHPACSDKLLMAAPCLPTMAPVTLPGITMWIWTFSGLSPIGWTSCLGAIAAATAAVPGTTGADPPSTRG
mmetsp:Transcript_87210/g.182508  ORF Transcript_87210/g.182508 Transcript_87210/m.182508 type:complete len:262 (+) Transcript_87210:502-1287(+)